MIASWLLRAAVVVGCVALSSDRGGAASLWEPASLERFCDSTMAVQLEKHRIPGAALIVVHDGRVLLARGYGYADLEGRVPVDPDRTVFRVASVSKLVTATAAMQLVEARKLDLHGDVNRTLHRFQVASRQGQPVTLFHLLTHTAGFDDRNIWRKARGEAGPESLGAYLARRMPPRVMPAGEFICYSNHGMALAGYLVEEASGLPFETYVVENIFGPLGMQRSRFSDTRIEIPVAYFDSRAPLHRFAGSYLNNRYGHGSLEKLSTLEGQLVVRAASDSTLLFRGHPYVRVEPLLFRRSDGPGVLAFRTDPSGRITHLFAGTSIARVYERLPWYATVSIQAAAIGFCTLAFLSACLAWAFAVVRRRASGARPANATPGTRGLAAIVGALNLMFLVGILAFLLGSPEELEYRVPASFVALLALPLVTAALGLVFASRTISAWKEGRGSRLQRLHASWVATAALGFAAILLHLNLLGFHF